MGKQLGIVRSYYLVAVCCIGSFLFAYDTGIVGGVLTLNSFQESFRYSKKDKTTINSNSNSLLQAGGTLMRISQKVSNDRASFDR